MNRNEFQQLARSGSPVMLDGATGTQLFLQGMPAGVSPEAWVAGHPEAIIRVQNAYVEAGSRIVYSCTFGGNRVKLAEFGLEKEAFELNRRLAEISRQAMPEGVFVFGDVSSTGKFIEPFGPLPFEEAVAIYREQAKALAAGGVDGFAIETLMDLQEARAALIGVQEAAPELPVIVTLTFDPSGRTMTGVDPVAALVTLQALGADAFGCNCSTGPDLMVKIIEKLRPYAKIPLVAKPNAGVPRLVDGKTHFDLDAAAFAAAAKPLVAAGAVFVGGCCGTTPEHIKHFALAVQNEKTLLPAPRHTAVVASPSTFRDLSADAAFTLIGERINPTGKKAFQAELRTGSLAGALTFAREQEERGAALLDVNLGLAGIDETKMMRDLVKELIGATTLPLSIDSTSPATVEAALRLYPGRALLNSITLEPVRLKEILPIAARYGAMPILLPLDETGVPKTAAEREARLAKLLDAVQEYGYAPRECVVDLLVMTAAADPEAPDAALDFLSHCAQRGLATTCGLSNVSFGLPDRQKVNLAFLELARQRGLSSAIANPALIRVAETAKAIPCDEKKLTFAEFLPQFVPPVETLSSDKVAEMRPEEALREAVLRGDRLPLAALISTLLERGMEPAAVANWILIPAIVETGARFERQEYYLPQLMRSAAAMESAMAILEPHLAKRQETTGDAKKPVFVLATVKGDIHDIGKNIVALLLRNNGFEVVDLGKDVPTETIVAAAKEHHASLVGLSALMTTTMPQMKLVVAALREAGLTIPVLTGGAAVDAEYARSIGAEYAADAVATVRLAEKIAKTR